MEFNNLTEAEKDYKLLGKWSAARQKKRQELKYLGEKILWSERLLSKKPHKTQTK